MVHLRNDALEAQAGGRRSRIAARRCPGRRAAAALAVVLITVVGGAPGFARADELSRRLLEELERRDRIIKTLTARVKALEDKLVAFQRTGAGRQTRAVAGAATPVARSSRSSRIALSDVELDRIVAGSLPRQFGSGGSSSVAVPRVAGQAALRADAIQLSQAANAAEGKPAAAAETPQTPAEEAAAELAAEEGPAEEERNVLRVPLASVARGGNLLRPGQFQIEPSLSYSYSENTRLIMTGFSVVPLVILGTLESEKVKNNSLATSLGFRYGVIRDLQFDAQMPVIWNNQSRTRLNNDEVKLKQESETDYGWGDLNVGLTYQPIYESGWIPDVSVSARVRAPTGTSQFDLFEDIADSGRFGSIEEFVQALDNQGIATGFGFWGLTLGTSFVKSADPAVLFGSVGYTFNFGRDVTTVGITQDPRGDAVAIVPAAQNTYFDPGDSVQFNVGFALALNSQLSVNFGFSDRIVFESKQDGNKIEGSNLHIAQFNTGFTLALRPRLTLDISGGFGLTPDAPDFTLGMSMPMTFNSVQDLIPSAWRSG